MNKLFRNLIKKSKAAKTALIKVVMTEINKEIKSMRDRKDDVVMGLMPTVDNLKAFSWMTALREIKEMAPSLFVLIKGCFGIKDETIKRGMGIRGEKEHSHLTKSSIGLSCTLRYSPITASTVGQLIKNYTPTRKAFLQTLEIDDGQHDLLFVRIVTNSYTLCWDNVAKYTAARHHSQESDNKLNLWALAYMAKNRIPTVTLRDKTTIQASCIPVEKFIPSPSDFHLLKERLEVIIKRILTRYVEIFRKQNSKAEEPFKHVTIGVLNENPSTTAGVIRILDKLQVCFIDTRYGTRY
ncbi:unnamed protein product [Mytilus coruscus]|uniref:Uncharacterized protein n=1 Tax=Mytilus coruscus TaxID=42192 RepID=A0A6J8B365_MYTCO|nr:unnamed protein product [Mytilus coruscus]